MVGEVVESPRSRYRSSRSRRSPRERGRRRRRNERDEGREKGDSPPSLAAALPAFACASSARRTRCGRAGWNCPSHAGEQCEIREQQQQSAFAHCRTSFLRIGCPGAPRRRSDTGGLPRRRHPDDSRGRHVRPRRRPCARRTPSARTRRPRPRKHSSASSRRPRSSSERPSTSCDWPTSSRKSSRPSRSCERLARVLVGGVVVAELEVHRREAPERLRRIRLRLGLDGERERRLEVVDRLLAACRARAGARRG